MVNDSRSKKFLLAVSFVIAIVLFFSGLGLGIVFDNLRTSEIDKLLTKSQLDIDSFLLQQQLLEDFDSTTCDIAKEQFVSLQRQRSEIGQKLEDYEDKSVSDDELNVLKRKHIILSVSSLSTLETIERNCGDTNIEGIIFFYAKDDASSKKQGFILDDVRNKLPDSVTVFAFDLNFNEEPLIGFLKTKYNATIAPTVIVNGDTKLEGVTDADKIIAEIKLG